MKNEMRIILNNEDLGVTFSNLQFNLPTSTTDYSIVFPHIGLKNVRAFVNFGVELPDPEGVAWPIPSYLIGKPYKFFGELSRFPNCILPTPRPPPSKSDCTVIFVSVTRFFIHLVVLDGRPASSRKIQMGRAILTRT